MAKQGKIIVVSGPSGVGKGTVNGTLFKDPKLNLVYSVSMTTRKPRPGETDGKDYFFRTKDQFEDAIKKDELIEHAQFVGNYYGTPRKPVVDQTKAGKNVLLEIEVDGATQVLEKEKNVLSIFLMPPSLDALRARLTGRGTEKEDVVSGRMDRATLEIPLKFNYEYVVENDDVENAVAKITDIFKHEGITEYSEPSAYEKLQEIITKEVEKDFSYFVENWKENIEEINKIRNITSFEYFNFNAKQELVKVLTDKAYKQVLAHGKFSDLTNEKFIIDLVKQLMIDTDFYSIKQKVINNAN